MACALAYCTSGRVGSLRLKNRDLAGYKVPGEDVFRDMLPLTPIGKVLKKELKAQICEEFGLPGA